MKAMILICALHVYTHPEESREEGLMDRKGGMHACIRLHVSPDGMCALIPHYQRGFKEPYIVSGFTRASPTDLPSKYLVLSTP
jgi:hypothetical protein